MKKIILLISFGLLLTGCLPKKIDETKTVGSPEPEAAPEENSLEAIEQELNQTEPADFDQELNQLDADINQL